MRSALVVLTLSIALTGCAGDQATDAATPAAGTKAVGSPGAAPANRDDGAKPKDDASVAEPAKTAAAPEAQYREFTVPAGTVLPLELRSSVGSDTSHVEDPVRATLRRPIAIGGTEVLPAGSAVTGHVTQVVRSARVKGRGRVAFRFSHIDLPGAGGQMAIRTGTITRVAPATKKQDAVKIGAGAAGGAIVGGILGGGDGAAKGAVVGGGAGTAIVLSTRGKDIRLGEGAPLSVKLTAPLTVRVRLG
jgi:hypothetical protein